MSMQKLIIIIRKWQPTPVCLPGKSHGQRSLVGNSQWGHKQSGMTEHTHTHTYNEALSSLKKEGDSGMCYSRVYLVDIMLSEISQSVTKRQILYDSTYM